MGILRSLVSLIAAAAAAGASPIERRAPIASDKVVGFAETVPSGTTGSVYLAYKPLLKVVNGCVPFPAVNAAGDTNSGLNPTGASNGQCSSSTGQVYVRGTTSNGYYALMYSWYMPKDSPSSGLGHRHDWEGVVVWLKSATSTAADNVAAVCPSAHGNWNCAKSGFTLSGTRPLIEYRSTFPLNHQLGLTTTVGGSQPLVAWESLTAAARDALQTVDFGDATVPFKDATFGGNLAEAAI